MDSAFLSLACSAALCGVAAIAADGGDRRTYLSPEPFAPGLRGWEPVGQARFDADEAHGRDGLASARIRVEPPATPAYQQLRREFGDDIRQGDELRAGVWVRTEGVSQDPGAYLALEFVAADGSRAGIAHSRTSARNGARGWERLEAAGSVPAGTRAARVSLILHAHGTAWFCGPSLERVAREVPWPDLGDRLRHVTAREGEIANPSFGGVGFHAFHHIFPASEEDLHEVIFKRWRELNPSFARLNDHWDYDQPTMERIARHMQRMKETGTEIYLTSWNPPDVRDDAELAAWARRVADNLEFYVRTRGLTNLRTYCMTNELSLNGWGRLANDLPRFRQYHQALAAEIRRRGLPVGLLATDAPPVSYWHTIAWAAENMDDITAVYGGHHYFNERGPDDERFYPWFLGMLEWGVGIARSRNKPFILGEFGARQDGRTVDGVRLDRCVFFETPMEPMVTLQLAEAVAAAINAGVYGMGYWTFMDLADDFSRGYLNRWGLFRASGADRSTRAVYYGYGLLTRYFRGPSTAFRVTSDDPRLRAAVVQHRDGTWGIAVVNRNRREVPVEIAVPEARPRVALRTYVYDPGAVRHHPFGDLPGPSGSAELRAGLLRDSLAPMSLTVYTSAFDETPPPAVQGVAQTAADGGVRVSWQAVNEPDLCYYRVYRVAGSARAQIGSTIATEFLDRSPAAGARYAVTAVDMSGNEGP